MAVFHVAVAVASWTIAQRWRAPAICQAPAGTWLLALARDLGPLAVLAYGIALAVTVAANADRLERLRLGSISGRLMAQALFGEAIVLGVVLSALHRRAGRRGRAGLLAAASFGLVAVGVDAYQIEPRMLFVRQHVVGPAGGAGRAQVIRILHLTDIQTPVIGSHEERALRTGMSYRPDLIVLTGDYLEDDLGRPTEEQGIRDLRELMTRIGFGAPLGVFATDGDAGPPCRDVFAGTIVRCLVDEGALVDVPGVGPLAITGLSRARGRSRNPAWLAGLLKAGPQGSHRIVISHAPDFVDAMPVKVDLVLAGHTHGGQVVIPFFGPPCTAMRLPRLYAGDLHDYNGIPLHVSRGIGMERAFTVPVRFLCPPEICVLDVRFGPSPRTAVR